MVLAWLTRRPQLPVLARDQFHAMQHVKHWFELQFFACGEFLGDERVDDATLFGQPLLLDTFPGAADQ